MDKETKEKILYWVSKNGTDTEGDYPVGECRCALHRFAIFLDSLPRSGWISVKDKLPRKSGWYLVANAYGTVFRAGFWAKKERFMHRSWKPLPKITHWQSLPDSPKE